MKRFAVPMSVLMLSFALAATPASAVGEVSPEALARIEEKQDRILKALEELKSELNIVKIRISSSR